MANGKEIKSRIKSIKNTGKITKAMELISTVKMKKSQDSVLSLRPFAPFEFPNPYICMKQSDIPHIPVYL